MTHQIALLAVLLATNAGQVSFNQIIDQPRGFHQKTIAVVGLAHIKGDRFYLYESVTAAARTDISHAIFIRQKENGPSYDRYDNRWLKVTGILDADLHGPLGVGFPCEILLEHVELINRPQETEWPSDIGEFKNETNRPIRVFLSNRPNQFYAVFAVGSGGINATTLQQGTVAIVTTVPKGEEATTSLVPRGEQVARVKLVVPPRTHRTGEPFKRTFYYRITNGTVESVPPAEGEKWKSK